MNAVGSRAMPQKPIPERISAASTISPARLTIQPMPAA